MLIKGQNDNWLPLIIIMSIKEIFPGEFLYYEYLGNHDTTKYDFIKSLTEEEWKKIDDTPLIDLYGQVTPIEIMRQRYAAQVRGRKIK